MNISSQTALTNSDIIVVFHNKQGKLSTDNPSITAQYERLYSRKILTGDPFELLTHGVVLDGCPVMAVFVGVGEHAAVRTMERAAYLGVKEAIRFHPASVQLVLFDDCTPAEQSVALQGGILAAYKFDKYLTKPDHHKIDQLILVKSNGVDPASFALAQTIAAGIAEARDLVNEPANILTPVTLGGYVLADAQAKGYTAHVYDEQEIQNLGMGAFYAVGKGAAIPPRLIVMEYCGNPNGTEKLGLIGKGLTYDSGGYSIKSTPGMVTMKADMAGAASVIAAMGILALTKPAVNVVGIVAACENLISGASYKPGDILRTMAGKTIEVVNTDAEGRLTLIDAITYAIQKQNVTAIVDIATLTGAAVGALGKEYTAVLANNDPFWDRLSAAAAQTGDKLWRLPIDTNIGKQNKSKVADLKNSGGSEAGTISAGMFIGEFVADLPWLHLDIAGPAIVDDDALFTAQGATGVPTHLLYTLAAQTRP